MKEFWNNRYSSNEYVYGKEPNNFFASFFKGLQKPLKIFFPGDGEGRNSVFAAENGAEVYAFDQSETGRKKAKSLAKQKGVNINFNVNDAVNYTTDQKFDLIVIIFLHLQPEIRQTVHKKFTSFLKDGGFLIMEVFSKKQANLDTGGPKNPDMLYDQEILENDFNDLQIIRNEALTVHLNEGPHHKGEAEVIRFIAKK